MAAPLFTFLAAQSNSQTSPALHLLSETSDGRCIDEICLCCTAVRLVFLSVVVVVHRFGQCFGQMLCKRIYGIKSVFTDLPNSQHAWKAELKWGVSTRRYVKQEYTDSSIWWYTPVTIYLKLFEAADCSKFHWFICSTENRLKQMQRMHYKYNLVMCVCHTDSLWYTLCCESKLCTEPSLL